jgi:2,5-dihydroxypyridine 5,6-dioxygenase
MAVGDAELIAAWSRVLTLSNLEPGQIVTILTDPSTHPQTLQTAVIAATALGAVVNRLDLPAMNAERSLSRDKLAYVGKTPLAGNPRQSRLSRRAIS